MKRITIREETPNKKSLHITEQSTTSNLKSVSTTSTKAKAKGTRIKIVEIDGDSVSPSGGAKDLSIQIAEEEKTDEKGSIPTILF